MKHHSGSAFARTARRARATPPAPRRAGAVAELQPASVPASISAVQRAAEVCLPHPRQLAALGTVLCLHRSDDAGELDGWSHAAGIASQLQVDSDGVRESLWFFDGHGQCCWRLYLLPESDFLAWDRLASSLPALPEHDAAGIGERLWRRLASRVRGGGWRMSVLRLQAVGAGGDALAGQRVDVSAPGATLLQRLAGDEGLDARAVVHDCCCGSSKREDALHGVTLALHA